MQVITLKASPLTSEAFAPFGDVIETEGATHFPINEGAIERYHDLATVSIDTEAGGRTLVSLARPNVVTEFPAPVKIIERHPLASQAFIPMYYDPMVVVVATAQADPADASQLHAFITNGRQGVNYHPGTWHMPLAATDLSQQWLVVDRGGPGENCDEFYFKDVEVILEI